MSRVQGQMEVEQANRTLRKNIEGPGNKWDVRKRQRDAGTRKQNSKNKERWKYRDNEREK